MGWFEDNGIYEEGGITGGRLNGYEEGATELYSSPGYRVPDDQPASAGAGNQFGAYGEHVAEAYRQFLGREASPDEIAAQLQHGRGANPTHLQSVLRSIQGSDEARTYATRRQAGPTSAPTTTNADPNNPEAFIASLLQSQPYGPGGLDAIEQQLTQHGYKIQRSGGTPDPTGRGTRGRIFAPNGQQYEVLDPKEGGDWWNNRTGTAWSVRNAGSTFGGGSAPGKMGQLYSPTGGGGYGGGGGSGFSYRATPTGNFTYENFVAPGEFVAPTEADMLADPGYKFRRDETQRSVERGAAARGALRTTGTMKDVANHVSGLASQEYGNVYGRRATEYDRMYGNKLSTSQVNNAGRMGAFNANTGAQLGFGNLDLGYMQAGNAYDLGRRNLDLGYYTADQGYNLGQGQLGLGWANYGLNADEQNFSQGYRLSDMGLRAAGMAGAYGSGYAGTMADLYGSQGNANAAGRVGSANAWANGLGNVGNTMGDIAMWYGTQPTVGTRMPAPRVP